MNSHLPEPKHRTYIDAVRGFAFLAVLTCHVACCVAGFAFQPTLLAAGGFGVQLFFLASAITLCYSMAARRKNERFPITFFFLRRFFRIAPLFWLAIVFYAFFPSLIDWTGPRFYGPHESYYFITALFLHGWHPYTFNSIVPGGWSIAVEMTFYAVFPLLFFYLTDLRKAALAAFAGIIFTKVEYVVLTSLGPAVYGNVDPGTFNLMARLWFPSQLAVFLVGIFTYHLLRNQFVRQVASERFWALGIFSFFFLLLLSVVAQSVEVGNEFLPLNLLVVLILAVIILTMSGSALPGVVNPVICFIGRISFSCYLIHFATLGLVLVLLKNPLTGKILNHLLTPLVSLPDGQAWAYSVLFILVFLAALAFTIPAATMTYYLIELPGIALGRRLIEWLSERGREVPAEPEPPLFNSPEPTSEGRAAPSP